MTVTGIEANIAQAVLVALEGQTFNDDEGTALPVAWPEVEFDPSEHPKYISVALLMNRPGWEEIGGQKAQRLAMLQISVIWPKNQGEIKPLVVASAIALAWQKGTILFATDLKIKVYKLPWLSGPISDRSRVQISVNIPLAAFAA